MKMMFLLPTRAKTVEERREEIGDLSYRLKTDVEIKRVFGYDILPEIKLGSTPGDCIRVYPDGLEFLVLEGFCKHFLVDENRKEIIEFWCERPLREVAKERLLSKESVDAIRTEES